MLFLGKITKSRGNKGEVVCSFSPEIDVSNLSFSGKIILKSLKHIKTAKMESYSDKGASMIMKLNISNSINDALRLVGYDVYLEKIEKEIGAPDLKGYSVADTTGLNWGVVDHVDFTGMNRLIEVRNGNEFISVPYTDSIVLDIDKKGRKILIDPPDGLRDLNK